MKLTIGISMALLLASTLAIGQQAVTTFPQAANPSLVNGERYLPLVVETNHKAATPTAMASSDAGSTESVLAWHHNVELGSAAEPKLDLTKNTTPADGLELGSPFPAAANPSR
jgi:hypothetical protein